MQTKNTARPLAARCFLLHRSAVLHSVAVLLLQCVDYTERMRYFTMTLLCVLCITAGAFAPRASASVTPTLQLSATGTADQVQVSITGDPNQSVLLSYTKAGAGPTISALGTMNGTGSFTTTVSSATYGLTSGTLVTALIGGTAGLRSQTVPWPTVTTANALTLSQNAVVLSSGSSTELSTSGVGSTALYVSNNANPSIANVSISGSRVTITGNVAGSTVVTLCQVGVSANCPTVSVVVLQSGASPLTFSQSSVTVVQGQNLPVTVAGGNGAYTIRTNTNASVIQASVSGAVLTLSTGSASGSASITVCSTDGASCGVVVATAGEASSVAITFSSSAPVLAANGSVTVHIYGPSGVTLYVSSNSAPSVVQASVSGTTLTLTGISAGSSTVSVCASTLTCAPLTVTVQSAVAALPITLSQNALSLQSGQQAVVTISGGTQPYALFGGTTSVSRQTLSGSSLTVYAVAPGTSNVQVCSAAGGCVLLVVTVSGSGSAASSLLSQSTLALIVGQSSSVSLSGGTTYYLSGNSAASVATASVSGATLRITASAPGTTNVTVCASAGACSTLAVSVTSAPITNTPSPVVTPPAYTFTEYLARGKEDAEVLALQKILVSEGFLSAVPNGYYGVQTTAAVVAFQKAHGIDPLGVVGPQTRSALNALGNGASTSSISTMSLSQLQSLVQTLESQLTQALSRIAQLQGH